MIHKTNRAERRTEVFQNAVIIAYDPNYDYFLVWYGNNSSIINVFDGEEFENVTCWTTGKNSATTGKLEPEEVWDSIKRRISAGDYP